MDANETGFRLPLDALFSYSDNCRRLLKDTLATNPSVFDEPIRPPLIAMRSIRHMTAHMAGAEERWIKRRILGEELVDYEERMAESIDRLFEDWEQIRT